MSGIGGDPPYHVDKGFSVAVVERRWKRKKTHRFLPRVAVVALVCVVVVAAALGIDLRKWKMKIEQKQKDLISRLVEDLLYNSLNVCSILDEFREISFEEVFQTVLE